MSGITGKRIVVTGGQGFIGSYLVKALLAQKAEVFCLVDVGSKLDRLAGVQVQMREVMAWKQTLLAEQLLDIKPEYIVNLRAQISKDGSQALQQANVLDVQELATAAQKVPTLKQFIHIGTIAEYGASPAPFLESEPGQPATEYGETKLAATSWLHEQWVKKHFPVTVLRFTVVYGPQQTPHTFLIPNVILNCLKRQDFQFPGNGQQTRDPLYVEDAVTGILAALGNEGSIGEIINCGLGQEYPVKEIAAEINRLAGSPIKIVTGSAPNTSKENEHYWLNIEKAKKLLGWQPAHSLADGLTKTINWYKSLTV